MELLDLLYRLARARGPAGHEESFAAAAEELLGETMALERD